METKHINDEHLIAFVAQELDEGEAQAVYDHLAVCSDCSALVGSFKSIRKLVGDDHMLEPPMLEPPLSTIERAYAIFHQHRTNAPPKPTWISLFRLFIVS